MAFKFNKQEIKQKPSCNKLDEHQISLDRLNFYFYPFDSTIYCVSIIYQMNYDFSYYFFTAAIKQGST